MTKRLNDKEYKYSIYLGRRGYKAIIDDVKIMNSSEVDSELITEINSLFEYSIVNNYTRYDEVGEYFIRENMPIGLDGCNNYITKPLLYTNVELSIRKEVKLYEIDNKIVYFL